MITYILTYTISLSFVSQQQTCTLSNIHLERSTQANQPYIQVNNEIKANKGTQLKKRYENTMFHVDVRPDQVVSDVYVE